MTNDAKDIERALSAPFHVQDISWKPQAVKGNRAMAIAYVNARAVMDRLDEVLGVAGWQDSYELLPDNSVVCRLACKMGGEWLTKTDVGSPSEQPDGGDRLKAAFSDALKRAAVKFGIARYLYRLPKQWVDFDPAKKQFTVDPRLPEWAMPGKAPAAKAAPTKAAANAPPANGAELLQRLEAADRELAAEGLCVAGALISHVRQAGVKAGYAADLAKWEGPAIELAIAETRTFKQGLKVPTPEEKKAQRFIDKTKAAGARA